MQACAHSSGWRHRASCGNRGPTLKRTHLAYLINRTWNHASHLLHTKHVGEGRREGGRGLNGGEGLLSNIGSLVETEDGARLVRTALKPYGVHRHALLNAHHVVVHLAHVVHVVEDEGLR